MTDLPGSAFLQSFREEFTRLFPEWADSVRVASETTLEVEIPAPNPYETNPLWIEASATGALIVAFGASHAHFELWDAESGEKTKLISQAIEFIRDIVGEDVVSIYLLQGGSLAYRSFVQDAPWVDQVTRITSWKGSYDSAAN
jgi:hypothetical protein